MQNNASISILFAGGARKVTGSNFIVEVTNKEKVTRVMIDCGLEQGARFCESTNAEPFSYDPTSIDAVFVTHAHADHIGLLPKLVKEGFTKTIYATAATADLIPIMLEDSVSLIAREAHQCGEEPPYTKKDLEKTLPYRVVLPYRKKIMVGTDVTVEFYNAGHIFGSALVVVEALGKRVLFTGDLGRTPAMLVPDPDVPERIDYLVTESVYGNRTHEPAKESVRALKSAIERVQQKKGTLLIPSFSLERTQIILAALDEMLGKKEIAPLPVFLDSPLATRVTESYKKHPEFLRENFQEKIKKGNDPFAFPSLRVTYTKDESKEVDETPPPKIIIAGAGMSHGGRVRSHEKTYLPDKNSALLLVGYQVPGSLGRRLQDGAKEVTIDRKKVKVRASVSKTGGFSAHADRDDLLQFVEKVNPREVFVVLGEMEASSFLAQRISGFLGIKTYIPQKGERIEIPLNATN